MEEDDDLEDLLGDYDDAHERPALHDPRDTKRRRLDYVDEVAPVPPMHIVPAAPNPYETCEAKCRISHSDINPHKSADGTVVPCPLMFRDSGLTFLNSSFEPVSPDALCNSVVTYMQDSPRAAFAATSLQNSVMDTTTSSGRCLIQSFFQYIATMSLMTAASIAFPDDQLIESSDTLINYLRMLELVNDPLHGLEGVDEDDRIHAVDTINHYIRFPEDTQTKFQKVLTCMDRTISYNHTQHHFPEDVMSAMTRSIATMKSRVVTVAQARQTVLHPNVSVYEREDPDHPRHVAMAIVQAMMKNKKVILTDAYNEERVLVAMPIPSTTGLPTFCYSPAVSIGHMLRQLNADQVVAEKYHLHKRFINSTLSSNSATSHIPYVPDTFLQGMRYIMWRNGAFCCRTCIMYYHRKCLPPEMPQNWKHFASSLETLNGGLVRAMKFIDRDLDYYGVFKTMLEGLYNRRTDPGMAKFYRSFETHTIEVDHGGDTLSVSDPVAQAAFVRDRMEHFDEWIHDKDFMAEMEPLDVQLRSFQKLLHDQILPRNVGKHLLEVFGRCLAGVIGATTRPISAAHRILEEGVGHPVIDRLEYATVLEGTAGSGKSSLIAFLECYMDEVYIGRVSDNRRPIDPHGTTRGKAVVIATDMQKEEQNAFGQGDVKKVISNEFMVNHRLHKESIIVQYLEHVLLAMNEPLPYTDLKGDIARRFAQIQYNRIISSENACYDNDTRTPNEVFQQDDIQRFAVVCCYAHMRRMVNVGRQPFYLATKPGFEVPEYLLTTQAHFGRTQNSFRAFILSLSISRKLSYSIENKNWSVERDIVLKDYEEYCTKWKAPMKDAAFTDRYIMNTFGVRIMGTPMRMYGLKYKDISIEDADFSDDPAPETAHTQDGVVDRMDGIVDQMDDVDFGAIP